MDVVTMHWHGGLTQHDMRVLDYVPLDLLKAIDTLLTQNDAFYSL